MAINLRVEQYCHNCDRFEADSKKSIITRYHPSTGLTERIVDTTITCVRAKECNDMYSYLMDRIKEANNDC